MTDLSVHPFEKFLDDPTEDKEDTEADCDLPQHDPGVK
jgi:hypothetical protein